MNIGANHVCIEAFSDSLKDRSIELDALRLLSMVNRDWHNAVEAPLKDKKTDTIRAMLDCVDEHGMCRIGSSGATFHLRDTKIRVDPLCSISQRLLEWRCKKRYQRIPDYSLLFSDSMFDVQKHHDIETETNTVMHTMRLLLDGTSSRCFEGHPALKLCWLYLLFKFILLAVRHDIYTEVFTSKQFAAVVIHKLKSYRDFLRANVKKVPDRLRYNVLLLFDDLTSEYKKC
jgi:hypothetical protein